MSPRAMIVCLLLAASLEAHGEVDYPSAVQLVASSEVLIELCSTADPQNAERYSGMRAVLNGAFAKANYSSYIGTPEYIELRAQYQKQLSSTAISELLSRCKPFLQLRLTAPGYYLYYE